MSNGNGTNTAMVKAETVMGSLAQRYQMEPGKLLDTLKKTCIRGEASNEQVQAFCIVANHYGLDPFLKEIHAFASGGGIVPIVGIDGWSNIANRTGRFDGCDFTFEGTGDKVTSCTCSVYVKGRQHPVRVTEYMAECVRATPTWKQYPRRMLRHKAFIQGIRLAFSLGGIYDEDEAEDIRRNESGSPSAKLAALNVAVNRPHPSDPEKTIDTSTSNEAIEGEEMDVPPVDEEIVA